MANEVFTLSGGPLEPVERHTPSNRLLFPSPMAIRGAEKLKNKRLSLYAAATLSPEEFRSEPRSGAAPKKRVQFSNSPIVLTGKGTGCTLGSSKGGGKELPYCFPEDDVPSAFSPGPAVFPRSNKSRAARHSSTATQEQRARCGCRGITVEVKSGSLGISLEACYSVDRMLLKQVWSDCDDEKDLCGHSAHVLELERGTTHGPSDDDGGIDSGRNEGKIASSGLIRVRRVGITKDRGKGAETPGSVDSFSSGEVAWGEDSQWLGEPRNEDQSAGVVPEGVLAVEEGDILVRVDRDQVSKKCFDEVVQLLEQAERPTRLVFVRHACGRRFRGHREGAKRLASPGNARSRGLPGTPRSVHSTSLPSPMTPDGWLSLTPSPGGMKKNRRQPAETEPDRCPVSALIRARSSLLHCGMEEWHGAVVCRNRLWQQLLSEVGPGCSNSDLDKLRRLTSSPRSVTGGRFCGPMTLLSIRKLTGKYVRLTKGGTMSRRGCSGESNSLAARVWKDVAATTSSGQDGPWPTASADSGLRRGDARRGRARCPVSFSNGLRDALFRVAYAAAVTLEYVSGIGYMAAVMLARTSDEAMAYTLLVTTLRSRTTRALYPAGDMDVLDGYHLCGGRVVCYRSSDPSLCEDDTESYSGSTASGHRDRRENLECRETQQVVVGEMLPRLVRAFGRELKRRLPALHKHLCAEGIPMSFLCAEWFTTAYLRNTPLPLALCATDLFLVGLDAVIIRLGLAILEVLEPSLRSLSARDVLVRYRALAVNVPYKHVLRRLLATTEPCQEQVSIVLPEECRSLGCTESSSFCSLS